MRPTLTYAAETRAETSNTKQLLRSAKMRVLRNIKGVTLRERIRSDEGNAIDVARWVRTRRRNWRDHVDRMGQDRWASWAPTDTQEIARWVRTRRRNWRDHVDRMGQVRWAS
jgi:hypothetical protein